MMLDPELGGWASRDPENSRPFQAFVEPGDLASNPALHFRICNSWDVLLVFSNIVVHLRKHM